MLRTFVVLMAATCFAACGDKAVPPSASSTTSAPPQPAASGAADVHTDTIKPAASTGPSEGSTAIGGVSGGQDAKGGPSPSTPAPTGGDAAASK